MGMRGARFQLGIWQVICDGNSLTAGVGTTPYPAQLESAIARPCINKGEPGWTTPQLTARFDATIPLLFRPQYRRSVAVLWEGTNDIILNNVSGATAWANMVAWIDKYKYFQCPFILMNIIARGNFTAGNRTAANDFNALMAANWQNIGAAGLCDVASVFTNYADLTKYNADQIHLITAGYATVATMVASTLAGTLAT
jgi:lysophospholipase L1-like esterase